MNKLTNILATVLVTLSIDSFAGSCPALSGEFTIGKSATADFATIQQASDALMCGGVSSPVLFLLENGLYNEKVTLSSIPGTSAFNTIVFESKSGEKADVIVSNQTSDATIVLNGTSYVSFENITVDHKKAAAGNCIRTEGNASNLVFKNVILDGVEAECKGVASAVVYFAPTGSKSNIVIIDCEINNGSMGICKEGASEEALDIKTVITGNLFFNQQQVGISLTNEDAPEIASNVVSSTYPSETFKGIVMNNISNQMIINKNVISAANGAAGLELNNCAAEITNFGQITNNSIVSGTSGISINGSTDNQILNFNRVKLSITGGNKTYYANRGNGNNINMVNNIFFDLNTGTYTVIGNMYKDFFNQLPTQSNPGMTASANALSVERVSPIK